MNGVINVYKEKGYTSHDVVAVLRKILKTKKIGHTGTLDPNAEGVLPVCVGQATKVVELLTQKKKRYLVSFRLGLVSDTEDIWGNVEQAMPSHHTVEEVREAALSFVGETIQIPPMYSAIKISGKKLYELARRGETVEREGRRIRIDFIRNFQKVGEDYQMEVQCSSGTYIRSLCRDIGERLRCGAVMTGLERTASGMFKKENALRLQTIETLVEKGELHSILLPVDEIFSFPKRSVKPEYQKWLYAGNAVPEDMTERITDTSVLAETEMAYLYDHNNTFIGIYRKERDNWKVVKFLYLEKKMEIIDLVKRTPPEPIILILGNFDGIHKGHQTLLNKAKQLSKEKGWKVGVFTFLPHPMKFLGRGDYRLVYTEEEKIEVFSKLGVDYYLSFPFEEKSREMSPEDFMSRILLEKLRVKAIVVGTDFRFGKEAKGNVDSLNHFFEPRGISVIAMEKLQFEGEDISSTELRKIVEAGDMKLFQKLTGRSYHMMSKVTSGKKIGSKLGFPTINLIPDSEKILPPYGVYATKVIWKGREYLGITNVGISPSVENKEFAVETYILDFHEMVYGETIQLQFLQFLRKEMKFSDLEELKRQIRLDVERANNFFINYIEKNEKSLYTDE